RGKGLADCIILPAPPWALGGSRLFRSVRRRANPFARLPNSRHGKNKPAPVYPASAHRAVQGHLADAARNRDYDSDGLRPAPPGDDLLLRRRPGHELGRAHGARHRRLTFETTELVMAKRWYIVHAYSNFEKKVGDSIREKAAAAGLSD